MRTSPTSNLLQRKEPCYDIEVEVALLTKCTAGGGG